MPSPTPATSQAPRAPRPIVTEPSLLVLKEKHGNGYYKVNNDDELFKVCLMVLRGRMKSNWYYEPEPLKPLGYTDKDIATMPPALQAEASRKLLSAEKEGRFFAKADAQWKNIQKAIQTKDGRLAYEVLRSRQDHEYEDFSIESFSTKYGKETLDDLPMCAAIPEEVERLQQLCVSWGGKIIRTSPEQMKKLEGRKSYFSAPFVDQSVNFVDRLGILWDKKRVVVLADDPPTVSDIIHEMGHVFATLRNPDISEEYQFFGWEYCVARVIGYPHSAWVKDNAEYMVDTLDNRPLKTLSSRAVKRLLEERVEVATGLGLIRDGLPIAIR